LPNLDRITVERTFGLFDRRAVVWAVEASQTSTAALAYSSSLVSRVLLCAKAYYRLLGNLFQGYDIIPANPA
jgi:hypothetical protein